MEALKNRLGGMVGDGSETDMPNFKPNTQKTKTFLQRIEVGGNLQFVKSNNLLPAKTDMAFTPGYRLNDKSVVGLGAAYKLGLGSIQRIRFTHEGIGLRSYLDWKIKNSIYISGGFELNYNAGLTGTARLQQAGAWQQSGLLGIRG